MVHPSSIEHDIYARFYPIEQVQLICIQKVDNACNACVFLQQDEYDEELMDCLLDLEWGILNTHQDTLFNFQYLPI